MVEKKGKEADSLVNREKESKCEKGHKIKNIPANTKPYQGIGARGSKGRNVDHQEYDRSKKVFQPIALLSSISGTGDTPPPVQEERGQ